MYNFLIVDDERVICDGMRDALQRLGQFNISVANSGKEALDIIQSKTIHAMFLDIAMPDMNGIELMKELAEYKKKPITIIISGYDEFDYAKEAMTYGAIDYVLKPIDSDDVLEMGNRINEILKENEKKEKNTETIRKFVLKNRKVIKQKLLYDILNNRTVSINLHDIYSVYGIDLLGEYFCGAVIQIRKQSNQIGELDFQIALKMAEDIIEEEISIKSGVNIFNMENARYVLLFSSDKPFKKKYISNILIQLMDRLRSVQNIECYVGKGNEVTGLYNISSSYYSANDALEYETMFGAGFVYDISDYRTNIHIQRLGEINHEFEERLSFMKYESAREKIEEYFDYIDLHKDKLTVSQKSFYIVKCMITYLSILFNNGQDGEGLFLEEMLAPVQQISNEPVSIIKMRVMRIFDQTIKRIENGYSEKHTNIVFLVKRYVDENYYDNKLSVNRLSEQLRYSSNYIGNVFKREYNMTINDYINKVRIEHAKHLMDETELKIYEIAYKVGFNDQYYFSKVFKKLENITPKEYSST